MNQRAQVMKELEAAIDLLGKAIEERVWQTMGDLRKAVGSGDVAKVREIVNGTIPAAIKPVQVSPGPAEVDALTRHAAAMVLARHPMVNRAVGDVERMLAAELSKSPAGDSPIERLERAKEIVFLRLVRNEA